MTMVKSKLKIGVIGCGDIANQKHMPALKKLNDKCIMTAFCDIKIEKARKAAKKYGNDKAAVYKDYRELLEDKSIDVVHVLTPNASHSPITIEAFKAGKHVMCEKPMAHNKKAAKKMMEAWQKSDKKFTIGYQFRFRNDVQRLKKACENKKLGEIYFAKAHAIRRKAVPAWGDFLNKSIQGGGPLIDIGTHSLDLTLWLLNNYEPYSVSGSVFNKMNNKVEGNLFGPWSPEDFEVEDSAFGFIKMKNGTTIFLESAWILNTRKPKEASTTLYGTKAGAEVKWNLPTNKSELIFNMIDGGNYKEERESLIQKMGPAEDEVDSLGFLEASHWIEAIIEDNSPYVKPEEAYIVTKILDAIYESAEKGKEIKFDD